MPQLSILSKRDRKRFDQPPVFDKEERSRYFHVPHNVRSTLSTIRKPTNRAGFLIQFAYFQSAGRFFPTNSFRTKDIKYVRRVFKFDDMNLTAYSDRMASHHRDQICSLLNWQKMDSQARIELSSLANRYVTNQDYPDRIFS